MLCELRKTALSIRDRKAMFSNKLLHPHWSKGSAANVVDCRCYYMPVVPNVAALQQFLTQRGEPLFTALLSQPLVEFETASDELLLVHAA